MVELSDTEWERTAEIGSYGAYRVAQRRWHTHVGDHAATRHDCSNDHPVCNRYETVGVVGPLKDRSRPGRKRRIEEAKAREVVERTLQEEAVTRDTLEHAKSGGNGRSESSQYSAYLESTRAETASSSYLQAE